MIPIKEIDKAEHFENNNGKYIPSLKGLKRD